MKRKLANLLIAIASKLDKFQVTRCTYDINCMPKVDIRAHVPDDDKWHPININLSYHLFVGKKSIEKEEVFIDGAIVNEAVK